jgi:hypothetical protein
VEGELAQRRAADRAGVLGHRVEIEPGGAEFRDRLAGDGTLQLFRRAGRADPLAGNEALQGKDGHVTGS